MIQKAVKATKLKKVVKTPVVKKIKAFRPRLRSRHPSHQDLRTQLPRLPFRSVVRLGSTTESNDVDVECNSTKAVRNSSSKLLMKQCFSAAGVITADWWVYNTNLSKFLPQGKQENMIPKADMQFPLIVKHLYGSRGTGNYKLDNYEALQHWLVGKDCTKYIFETYKTYTREYRLHVTAEGCFYTCRKMLKRDTPEDKKFQRHDDNCVWILEENQLFDKPVNWKAICDDCVKALNSLGLDIGAFDLKVQSAVDGKGRKRENPEWIVIESCSAPSFGERTLECYLKEIPKVLTNKFNNKNK